MSIHAAPYRAPSADVVVPGVDPSAASKARADGASNATRQAIGRFPGRVGA